VSLRADAGWGSATYDGAWWPRTRDLATELPELVAELGRRGVRVERFTYSFDAWPPLPRKIAVPGRVVRTGGFQNMDPQAVSVSWAGGTRRADLLVIPPETDAITGVRALRLCCTHLSLPRSSRLVMAIARATPTPQVTLPEQRDRQAAGGPGPGSSTASPAGGGVVSSVSDSASPPRGPVVVGYPGRTTTPPTTTAIATRAAAATRSVATHAPQDQDDARQRVAREPRRSNDRRS
jgi:hypothetical protein